MKTNANIKRIVEQHKTLYKTNILLEFSETSFCVYIGFRELNDKLRQSLLDSIRDNTTTARSEQEGGQTWIYVYRDYEYVNNKKILI